MKQWICAALAVLVSGSVPAMGAEWVPPHTEATTSAPVIEEAFDGYLISMPEDQASLFSLDEDEDMEYVTGNVYWTNNAERADELRVHSAVKVEPNYYVTLFDTIPAEGSAGQGWANEIIHTSYPREFGLTGKGVRVAVVDSGVDRSNPDLTRANIADGCDYLDGGPVKIDTVYHGTKVTQLIVGDDNGRGAAGIAPEAEIVPLRCFSTNENGTVRVLAQAVTEAVDKFHCNVINMSWGLKERSEILHQALVHAKDAGAILISAAGNVTSRYPQGTPMYPACFEEVIGVAAADTSLNVLQSSQKTGGVQVCAPGGSLHLIEASGSVSTNSGTSFASPCVTAAAALVRQLAPTMNQDAFLQLIQTRTEDLGKEGYDTSYGYGFLRLDQLLGTSWGQLSTSLSGWLLAEGTVAAASYDAQGRMLGITLARPSENEYRFSFSVNPEAASYALFFMGDRFGALDTSLRFPAAQ